MGIVTSETSNAFQQTYRDIDTLIFSKMVDEHLRWETSVQSHRLRFIITYEKILRSVKHFYHCSGYLSRLLCIVSFFNLWTKLRPSRSLGHCRQLLITFSLLLLMKPPLLTHTQTWTQIVWISWGVFVSWTVALEAYLRTKPSMTAILSKITPNDVSSTERKWRCEPCP